MSELAKVILALNADDGLVALHDVEHLNEKKGARDEDEGEAKEERDAASDQDANRDDEGKYLEDESSEGAVQQIRQAQCTTY